MKKISMFFVMALVFISATAFAGGYQVRLEGNKQTGMGLIGAPLQFGVSSMFYNPGALSFMKGKFGFDLGGSGIFANVTFEKYESDYIARTDNPVGTPFYFYVAGKVSKNIAVGFAIYTPYGSAEKWNSNWALKYLIQNISLQAVYFQPTVSIKMGDKFGIGAGLVFVSGSVDMNRALNYSGNSGVHLNGKAHSFGFNVGAHYKASDQWSVGVTYRSRINMDIKNGDATFHVPDALSAMIPTTNHFSSSLPLPSNLDIGVAYRVTKKVLLAAELDWVRWSVYDSLSFKFKTNPQLLNSISPRLYKDNWIPRIGVQYKVSDKLLLRAGAYYETSPANKDYFSPETVTLNTFAYTLGVSYLPVKGLSIDASFIQLFGQNSKMNYLPANAVGYYKTNTVVPGLGISYHF